MNKKVILSAGLALTSLLLFNNKVDAATKDVTSLEKPSWVLDTGMTRGMNHDRQDLGFVMNKGSQIKIRKASTNDGYNNATLWLLNDNNKTEKSYTLTTDWQTITVDNTSVPFINTPYGQSNLEIEYDVQGQTTELPVYKKGDDQSAFLAKWEKSQASFAIIQGNKFQLMINISEQDKLKNLNDFANIDDYINYQDELITYYDHIMGLSETSTSYNKMPQNRFFLKADTSAGVGVGAYYDTNYTANGGKSVVDSWMKKANWKTLHELGHGYQPNYSNSNNKSSMYTGEVSNNLLGNMYLLTHFGKEKVDSAWLYDNGQKDKTQEAVYQRIVEQKQSYSQLPITQRERLVILTNIIQSADISVWTDFNDWYRKSINENNPITQLPLPDLLNMYYSQATGHDYTPVFSQFGISLTQINQSEINREAREIVSPLSSVVPKNQLNQASSVLTGQITDSIFNLVTNQQLKQLGLNGGTLILNLSANSDQLNNLKGKTVVLKDGSNIIKKAKINSNIIDFGKVDNGSYSIEIIDAPINIKLDTNYVFVKESQNQANISISDNNYGTLFNQPIILRGISDGDFAYVTPDFDANSLTINTLKINQLHPYFNRYAEVKVMDDKGNVIFDKEFNGKVNNAAESVNVPIKEGYQIEIYHTETQTRLKSNILSLVNPTKNNTNKFVVKKGYLENVETHNNGIRETINQAIQDLRNDNQLKQLNTSTLKKNIILGLNLLTQDEKNEILRNNAELLTIKAPAKEYTSGIKLTDNLGTDFATIKTNITNGDLALQLNDLSNSKLNAYIEILDENGKSIYQNLISSQSKAITDELDLKSGYQIKLTQPDNYSSNIENSSQKVQGAQIYYVQDNQLVSQTTKSATDEIISAGKTATSAKLSKSKQLSAKKQLARKIAQSDLSNTDKSNYMNQFDLNQTNITDDTITINGRNKKSVIQLTTNQNQNKMQLDITANKPRTTSTIEVLDENGNQVLDQVVGNNNVINESKVIDLKDNYTVKLSSSSSNSMTSTFNQFNTKQKQAIFVIQNDYLVLSE
ncbi:putative mucin/carbohydrate-binding domain-containing protein [Holzapfeliella sp. JNUCC 80]